MHSLTRLARLLPLVLAWLVSPSALAQAPGAGLTGPAPERAQGARAAPTSVLSLRVEGTDAGLSPEALRTALERELGMRVALTRGAATVAVDLTTPARVPVRYAASPSAAPRERVIDLSHSGAHWAETLALVVANLLRDEASELLSQLAEAEAKPVQAAPVQAPPVQAPQARAPEADAQQAEALPRAEAAPEPRGCDARPLRHVPFAADLVPGVGATQGAGGGLERGFSLNLVGGRTAALRGVELALGFNLEDTAVCGVQLAGGANLAGGPVEGVQMALANLVDGRVDGVQLALVNGATGSIHGVQGSLVNLTEGDTHGMQLGLVNVGFGDLHGVQGSLVNVAGGSIDGLQAGLVNVTGDRGEGLQAGLANVSSGAFDGAQLGLVNVTHGVVDGAMVGLVNVAEDADVAIGLVSVLSRGRTHFDAWLTSAGIAMVGVEHGGRGTHNLFGVGFTRRHGHVLFAAAYGLGTRLYGGDAVFVDLDAILYGLYRHHPNGANDDLAAITELRVPFGFNLGPVWAFIAPTLNASFARTRDNRLTDPSLLGSARLTSADAPTTIRLWPGLTLGLRLGT